MSDLDKVNNKADIAIAVGIIALIKGLSASGQGQTTIIQSGQQESGAEILGGFAENINEGEKFFSSSGNPSNDINEVPPEISAYSYKYKKLSVYSGSAPEMDEVVTITAYNSTDNGDTWQEIASVELFEGEHFKKSYFADIEISRESLTLFGVRGPASGSDIRVISTKLSGD